MCATQNAVTLLQSLVPHHLTSKDTLLEMWPPPSSLYEILFYCLYNISLFQLFGVTSQHMHVRHLYVWMLDRVLLINVSLNQNQWYYYLPSLNLDVIDIFFLPILGSKHQNDYYLFHLCSSYHWLFLALVKDTSRYVISADRFGIWSGRVHHSFDL